MLVAKPRKYPKKSMFFTGDVGDEIDMLYDPKNPKRAVVNHILPLWGGAAFPAVGGAFCLYLSILLYWKRRRR